MVRFHWHVESGQSAYLPPGAYQYQKDSDIRHAACEVEIPAQRETLQTLLTLPAGYLNSDKIRDVGIILAHGTNHADWKGKLLTEIAVALATEGFVVMRYCCKQKEQRRLRMFEKALDACATSPFARTITRWVVAGHGNGARVAAVVGMRCRGDIAGFALLSYPLKEIMLPAKSKKVNVEEESALPPTSEGPLLKIVKPVLFVVGERDELCPVRELAGFAKDMPSSDIRFVTLPEADSGFKPSAAARGPTPNTIKTIVKVVVDFVTAISEESLRTCDLPTLSDALAALKPEPEDLLNSHGYPAAPSEPPPAHPEWYEPQHGGMQVMDSGGNSDDDGSMPPHNVLGSRMSGIEDMSRGVPLFPMDRLPSYPTSLPQHNVLDVPGLDPLAATSTQAALPSREYQGDFSVGFPPLPEFSQAHMYPGQVVGQSAVQAQPPMVYSQAQPMQAMSYGQVPHTMQHNQAQHAHAMGPQTRDGQPDQATTSTQGLAAPNPVQGYSAQGQAHSGYGMVQSFGQPQQMGQLQFHQQAPQQGAVGSQWIQAAQQGLQGSGLYPGQAPLQSQAYPSMAQAQPLRAHASAPFQAYPSQQLAFSMQYPVQPTASTQQYPTHSATSQPYHAPPAAPVLQQNPVAASAANPNPQASQVAAHLLASTEQGALQGFAIPARSQQPPAHPASLPLTAGAAHMLPFATNPVGQQGGARPLSAHPTPAQALQPSLDFASGSAGRQAVQAQGVAAANQAGLLGLGNWGLAGDSNSVTANFLRMLQAGGVGRPQPSTAVGQGQSQPDQAAAAQVFAALQKQHLLQQQQQQVQQLQQSQTRQPQQQPPASVSSDIQQLLRQTQMAQQAIALLSQVQGQARLQGHGQPQHPAHQFGMTQAGHVHPQGPGTTGGSSGIGGSTGFPTSVANFLSGPQNPMPGPPGQDPKP